MNPIANHELGQARHRELQAEFAPYRPEQFSQANRGYAVKVNRLVVGLGSILFGMVLIGQILAS